MEAGPQRNLAKWTITVGVLVIVAASGLCQQAEMAKDGAKLPTAQGVYQEDGTSTWKLMDKAPMPQLKTKGAWAAAFSYGAASVKAICAFSGPKATNVATNHPRFLFVAMQSLISMRDIAIVRLQASKDKREVQYASARAWSGPKLAYRVEDLVDFSVQTNADGSFTVEPKVELQPGEYLLTAGPGCNGRDFTVPK
jgi:hypothetical protein